MKNPFGATTETRPTQSGPRERFRVTVYGLLGAFATLIFALLIQGCRQEHPDTALQAPDPMADIQTNAPATETPIADSFSTNQAVPDATASYSTSAPPSVATSSNAPSPTVADTQAAAPSDVPGPTITPPEKAKEPAAKGAPATTYTVRRGDTLTHIAKTHGTTVAALKALNGLKTDRIAVGKKLKLPAKSAQSASLPGSQA